MADFKQRFQCVACGSYCTPKFNIASGGRFHACDPCWQQGKSFTVEWDPPHRAYGDVAEAFDVLGKSQTVQVIPTVRFAEKLRLQEEFRDLVMDAYEYWGDTPKLRAKLLPQVQALRSKYAKLTVSHLHWAIEQCQRIGNIPTLEEILRA